MTLLLLDGSVFTAAQASANRVSAWCLAEMVAHGRVRRLLHDAYVDAHVPERDSAGRVIYRLDLERRYGWDTYGFDRGDVLGMRPNVELAVGALLGMEPVLPRRWRAVPGILARRGRAVGAGE